MDKNGFFRYFIYMITLIHIIQMVFQVYMLMLIVRILGSWIPELHNSRFMQFLSFYTDPYLNIFRKIIPPIAMIDLSPIVAFIMLSILENVLVRFIVMFFV